jgi:hypothetical protein
VVARLEGLSVNEAAAREADCRIVLRETSETGIDMIKPLRNLDRMLSCIIPAKAESRETQRDFRIPAFAGSTGLTFSAPPDSAAQRRECIPRGLPAAISADPPIRLAVFLFIHTSARKC